MKNYVIFLQVDAPSDYLKDCTKIIYKSPNKSRYSIDWTPELIAQLQANINQYQFLSGYTYDT